MEILLFKPKALKSRFGVGGSTRSLLAASEQDFGVPKQNLRGALRFGPIFYPSLSFRTGSGVTPDEWGQRTARPRSRSPVHTRPTKGWFCL
ncbi:MULTISPECIES: hypothetical protein [Burkholderia]|uniref:hypothetical protein n=1 Tax=Burkholderia TaxID=32008 RepID=UPI0015819E18|nr:MULTISPECIES: hypothetical protein [Burkholderia]